MRRQRNNVVRLSFDLRRVINRMLVDGCAYAEVNAEIRRLSPSAPKLHSSTLAAWQRSPEYIRYRTAREVDDAESAQTRAMAAALNDGQGPESVADLTAMEVLKALWHGVKGGQVTDFGDLAQVTKALAPILRAQIAADTAAARRRETDLLAQLAAQDAAHEEELGKLREALDAANAEIAALRTGSEGKGGLTPEGLRKIEEGAKLL